MPAEGFDFTVIHRRSFCRMIASSAALPMLIAAGGREAQQRGADGLRRVSSRHLTLVTDLPEQQAVDELPDVFDLAVPQWCEYFGVPAEQLAQWHVTAYLMQAAERFQQAGLLPGDLPQFLHGYQRGNLCWLYEQPSDYYRRVLLLHEGTHAFMQQTLGGAGPPWYMEGMAEYLGTHRYEGGELQLRAMPRDRNDAAYWGRIKVLREQWHAGRPQSLVEIMRYPADAHLRVEAYAWSWAAVSFFDQHPEYQAAFRRLRSDVADTSVEFSRRWYRQLEARWRAVELAWYAYLAEVDYGYQWAQALVTWPEAMELPASGTELDVDARRGWQATGLRLAAGKAYRLTASGRYGLRHDPSTWWAEPPGITLRYHAGFPLGALLAAVVPDEVPAAEAMRVLDKPQLIGREAIVRPERSGMLLIKINDSPAELAENEGASHVQIHPAS